MPPKPHDRLFKTLLSQPSAALALAAHLLPPTALEGVTAHDLRAMDTALTGRARARTADRRWSVRLGGRRRMTVLLEHQATPDARMAERLTEEILAIARPPGQRLTRRPAPPVVPIVVYQGRRPWGAPLQVADHFDLKGPRLSLLREHTPHLRYLLLDLCRTPDAALPDHPPLWSTP